MQHDLTLRGPVVSLEPLTIDHAEAWAAMGDLEAYSFHTSEPPLTTHVAAAHVERFHVSPFILALAVLDSTTSELRGVTTFYEHDPNVPRVEIGSTFYGRRFCAAMRTTSVLLGRSSDSAPCRRGFCEHTGVGTTARLRTRRTSPSSGSNGRRYDGRSSRVWNRGSS